MWLLDTLKTWAAILNPVGALSSAVWWAIGKAIDKKVNPEYSTSELMNWNRYSISWLANLLNSESQIERNTQINKQLDNIANKHTVRMNIANWNISSWSKGMDKLEKARSALADYARISYLTEAQKDVEMDLWVLDKMTDQDIIDWMTEWDDNAKNKYLDFINKGWVVWDVYNDIMWINPEAVKEEEKQQSSWGQNFIWAATNEIPRQLWGLMDIMWISKLINDEKRDELGKYKELNTDEYNKFINGEISMDELNNPEFAESPNKMKKSWMYLDYKRAVDNWQFVWSVEDYGNTMYNKYIWDTEKTAQEHLWDESWINYNEEWDWADAGKMTAQTLEFLMMPGAEGNWLKRTLVWAGEILWIDALSEWKLPSKWEAGLTTAANWILEWLIRFPWGKWLTKQLAWMTPEVKNALWKITKWQWNKYSEVVSNWLEATKHYATELLDKAAVGIKDKLELQTNKLKLFRENMEWDFNYKNFFDSINKQFKKFEREWWDKNAVPEIKVWKDWKLEIYNEEALSNIKDSNGIKLTDMLKSEWEAFRNQGREWSIRDAEKLMNNMEWLVYNAVKNGWIKSTDSATKAILEWIKDGYKKLYTAMWKHWEWFKNAREDVSKLLNYQEFWNKYVGNIKLWESPLAQLEKTEWGKNAVEKNTDTIWEFLKILQDDKIVKDDVKSELIWLVYAFWIKNPRQVQRLLEGIYPSLPGIQEVFLEMFRQRAKSKYAESLLKDSIKWESPWNQIMRAVWQGWLVQTMK